MTKQIEHAIKILNSNGIIIFPTDTAFGIGCRIDKKDAVKRLIQIRGRRKNQPLPVLVNNLSMAKKYLKPFEEKDINTLVKKYWPGGLTIIFPCDKKLINPIIRGDGNTLGVRMPNHKLILEVIEKIGVPIIGCSANFSGENSPFCLKDINKKLIKSVDFVLNGKCLKQQSSTVIDCSKKPWKILRQGPVVVEELKNIELNIDTSSNKDIVVELKIGNKKYIKKQRINFQKAQIVLPMINSLLKSNGLLLRDLTSIKVNEGPGSFTGLRVGISVANTLGYFLKIPINGKKPMELVSPIY